jgi:hypothetical protein
MIIKLNQRDCAQSLLRGQIHSRICMVSKLGGGQKGGGHPFLGERVGGGTTFSAREKENIYF